MVYRWLHLVLGASIVIASPGTVQAEIPTDPSGLTSYFALALAKALPEFEITVEGPLTLDATPPGHADRKQQVRLNRIYDFCSRNPSGCERAAADFVTNSSGMVREADAPLEPSMIRAVVRPAAYIEEARRYRPDDPKAQPIAVPLAGELWVLYMADTPHAARLLRVRDAERVGLSADAVIDLGKRNVEAALRPFADFARGLPSNGIGTIVGDYYESSRLSLHDDWSGIAGQMKGGLIVAVPSNDAVLYGDAGQPNGIDAMAGLAREMVRKSPRPISATVFKWTKEGWEPVQP
ncbi:MAG TPA: DUF1444 family protein [Stellaceae bacterium]|nr:DUF1444 family protein [Stellaceae bacterium]